MARPFIRVPHVARFTVTMVLDGVPFSNCFHFHKFDGNWTETDLHVMNLSGLNAFRTTYLQILSRDVHLKSVKSESLEDEDFPSFEVDVIPTPGGYDDDSLPLNIALYCRLHPRARVKDKYHYLVLGGIPKSTVTGNLVSEDYKDLVRFAGADFLDNSYMPPEWDWVYIEYIHNGHYLPFGLHYNVIFARNQQVHVGTRARRARNKLRTP